MKIALINDTHAGLRNSSDEFLDYAEKFYSEIFFPYCKENGITQVIHLGDYLDHRKYVNFKVLNRTRKMFLEPLVENGMQMTIIPGNHDVYFRNTNALCGLREVLGYFTDNVKIIMKPEVIRIDGLDIAMLPWMTADNCDESLKFISTCAAPILMAHLELAGFEMMKGMPVAAHGMDSSIFKRFEMVLSGHYHTKSSKDNIHYLGTQYEQTWADADDPKYFHVLDTTTRELMPIRNPHSIFQRFVYNDSLYEKPMDILSKTKFSRAARNFVKVIVAKKNDAFIFDRYIDELQKQNPIEMKIIESMDEFIGDAVQDDAISLEDTSKLLNTYVDAVETDLDKERIKSLMRELFVEASALDSV